MSLCNICLRTNLTVNKVGEALIKFYDNLLDHQIFPNLSLCANCKQLLEKCYDFKQLCLKSNNILQNWRKKKKPDISLENLHSLIQPSYDKVSEINDDRNIESIADDISILIVTNNHDSVPNNNDEIEYIENKCTENDNDDDMIDNDYDIERLEDGFMDQEDLCQHNEMLTETIKLNHMNSSTEPCEETDMHLSDNVHNGTGDNECNGSENNSAIQNNTTADNCDNDYGTDDDSCDGLELINKLLEDAKKKTEELNKQNSTMKNKISMKKLMTEREYKENYGSVFDIVVYKSEEEAKAEVKERPNSDYYKNAAFKCTICYTVFKSQKKLDYHMGWHDPSAGDHVCDICGMRYKTRRRFKNHKNHAHFGKYSCKKCPLITHHRAVMTAHFKIHEGILFKCKYCEATSRHHQNYLAHLRKFHPSIYHQTNHVCKLCGHTFASPNGLAMHKSKVHQLKEDVETESSVECKDCDITFANEDAYTVHVMNTPCHKDFANSLIACSICGKRFYDKMALFEHKRQYHPFRTSIMHKSYKKSRVKDQKGKEATCKECGATGSNHAWLFWHCKKKHPQVRNEITLEKKHLCDQCGKSFHMRCHLVEHARVHTGECPFVCVECGATFNSRIKLYYHAERHRPPSRVCAVCGKKFVSSSNLSNHMRIHIGDRRYKCTLCGKGFLHTTALQEHVRGVHLHVRRVKKPKKKREPTPEQSEEEEVYLSLED